MRVIGLLLIVGSSLGYYLTAPRSHWQQQTLASVPLSLAGPTRVTFTASDTVDYHVGVNYRYTGTGGTRHEDGVFDPAFTCNVKNGERVINGGGYQGIWYGGDGATLIVRSFPGQAERTYTVSVAPKRGGDLLRDHEPRLAVFYDQRQYVHDMMYTLWAAVTFGFWCLVGLLLTWLSRKR